MKMEKKLEDKNWYPENDEEAIALFQYMQHWFWERTRLEKDGKAKSQECLRADGKFSKAHSRFIRNIDRGKYITFTSTGDSMTESLYKYKEVGEGDNVLAFDGTRDKYKIFGSMWDFKDEIAVSVIPEDLVEYINQYREENEPKFGEMTRQEVLAYMKENEYPIDYMKLTDEELVHAVETCYYHNESGITSLDVKGVRYDELEIFEDEEVKEVDLDELDRDSLIDLCTDQGIELPDPCDYSETKLREVIIEYYEREAEDEDY